MIDDIWKDYEVICWTPTNKWLQSDVFSDQRLEGSELFEDSIVISSNWKSENKAIGSKLWFGEVQCKEEEKDQIHCVKSEQFPTPVTNFQSSPVDMESMRSEFKYSLSSREDVLNKGAIRVIRKYYRDKFKNQNKNIVKKRIVNCKSKDIIEATEALCKDLFPTELWTTDLHYYIAGILKLKGTSYMHRWSNQVKEEINQFLDCVRMYSKAKFRSLLHSQNFKLIWKHVVDQNLYQDKTEWLKNLLKIYKD